MTRVECQQVQIIQTQAPFSRSTVLCQPENKRAQLWGFVEERECSLNESYFSSQMNQPSEFHVRVGASPDPSLTLDDTPWVLSTHLWGKLKGPTPSHAISTYKSQLYIF